MKDYFSVDFLTDESNPNIIICSYSNFDKIEYLKFNLNLQKKFGWWSPSLSVGCTSPFFKCEYLGEMQSYNKIQLYTVLNQYITLPKGYLLNLYYYYNTGGNQDVVVFKSSQMLNINIQKSFFKDRLSVKLSAKDIFHGMKFRETE